MKELSIRDIDAHGEIRALQIRRPFPQLSARSLHRLVSDADREPRIFGH